VFTTFEDDNTVLMMLVTRGLLTDYRDHFGELNPRELVMFVATRPAICSSATASSSCSGWREGHMTASR